MCSLFLPKLPILIALSAIGLAGLSLTLREARAAWRDGRSLITGRAA